MDTHLKQQIHMIHDTFIYRIYWMHILKCIPIWLPSLHVHHVCFISWFLNSQKMLRCDRWKRGRKKHVLHSYRLLNSNKTNIDSTWFHIMCLNGKDMVLSVWFVRISIAISDQVTKCATHIYFSNIHNPQPKWTEYRFRYRLP